MIKLYVLAYQIIKDPLQIVDQNVWWILNVQQIELVTNTNVQIPVLVHVVSMQDARLSNIDQFVVVQLVSLEIHSKDVIKVHNYINFWLQNWQKYHSEIKSDFQCYQSLNHQYNLSILVCHLLADHIQNVMLLEVKPLVDAEKIMWDYHQTADQNVLLIQTAPLSLLAYQRNAEIHA